MSKVLKRPDFMFIEVDGTLSMEWCFGSQGHPDSYRFGYYTGQDGEFLWRTSFKNNSKLEIEQLEWKGCEARLKMYELLSDGEDI